VFNPQKVRGCDFCRHCTLVERQQTSIAHLSVQLLWLIEIRRKAEVIAKNPMSTARLCSHDSQAIKGTNHRLGVLSDSG